MEHESLKLLLNRIMRSDISFACLGIVVSFIYRHLFPCYLIKETIFFNTIISNIWYLKCSEKCSSKFFHKFELLRMYILKDSRILLQKYISWNNCTLCALGKKNRNVKPKNWSRDQISTKNITFWEIVWPNMYFSNFQNCNLGHS